MHIHIYINTYISGMVMIPEKTKATIVVEQGLWKEFKKLAIDKDMQISELIEKLVGEYLSSNGHSQKQ